jgi:hypothetical protein
MSTSKEMFATLLAHSSAKSVIKRITLFCSERSLAKRYLRSVRLRVKKALSSSLEGKKFFQPLESLKEERSVNGVNSRDVEKQRPEHVVVVLVVRRVAVAPRHAEEEDSAQLQLVSLEEKVRL